MSAKGIRTLLFAAVAASSMSIAASAGEGDQPSSPGKYYASIFVGSSFSSKLRNDWNSNFYEQYDLSTGWSAGASVGMRVLGWARVEAELSHQEFGTDRVSDVAGGVVLSSARDTNGHHVAATYLLGNVWADIPTPYSITPYFGGGAGAAWANLNGTWPTPGGETKVNGNVAFAWQLGGGFQYDFAPRWGFDAGYRFKRIENAGLASAPGGQRFDGALQSHTIQIGIARRF